MKRMLLMMSLLLSSEQTVFSDWKLGKIYNDSDLKFDSARRHKSKQKKNPIYVVTKALNDALPHQRIVAINYHISQKLGTISILAIGGTQKYDIFFEGHSTYALESKRAKTQAITTMSYNSGCKVTDGSYCARVWMNLFSDRIDATPIAKAFYPHDTEPNEPMITLDLTIQGTKGSYSLSLSEPKE
ncbi:MAG: hypothetical protein WC747_01325 [Candidatus Babeliales bacterium]|jgi:hypothetical protein